MKRYCYFLFKTGLLSLFLISSINVKADGYSSWSIANTKGENYISADGNVKTFSRPDEYTYLDGSPRFNVFVNGQAYTGLYDSNNPWGGNVTFGYFDFKDGTPVDVVISCRKELGDYDLLPAGAEVSNVTKLTDKILKFTISKANQNITLVLGGDYQTGDVLHLFCNDIDQAPGVASTEGYSYDKLTKTYYFGPGYYDLSTKFTNGILQVSGGRNIYLAGGAVVHGTLRISGAGSKIYGHGMVVSTDNRELDCTYCTSGVVDGILCHRFKVAGWQTTYTQSSNLTIKNLKIICTSGGSTDGMDLNYCQNCTFDNIFVRANDDAVAIKGLITEGDPLNCPAEKDLTFSRMQLWNDCNNAFGMGAETRASSYENIKLLDSDILYSYDDKTYHGTLDERSAMNICALQGTYFHNILFENVRVNKCERLIGLGFKDSFWFGSIVGDQSFNGGIYDVTFRNITCPNNSGSSIANDVWLYGWHKDGTPDKFIHDIYFDNVKIEGELLDSWQNRHLKTNNTDDLKLVYDLHFGYSTAISSPIMNAERNKYGIYQLNGDLVRKGYGEKPDLTSLPPSLYIIKYSDKKSQKVIVK